MTPWPRRLFAGDGGLFGLALRRAEEDRAARRRARTWRDVVLALLLAGAIVAGVEELAHWLAKP